MSTPTFAARPLPGGVAETLTDATASSVENDALDRSLGIDAEQRDYEFALCRWEDEGGNIGPFTEKP
jgi:hypothetical protein